MSDVVDVRIEDLDRLHTGLRSAALLHLEPPPLLEVNVGQRLAGHAGREPSQDQRSP